MVEPTLATRAADTIRGGFDEYHNLFREVTRRARERFERGDWDGIRRDTTRRLDLHERIVLDTLDGLSEQLGDRLSDRRLWQVMKDVYWREVLGRDDFELARIGI